MPGKASTIRAARYKNLVDIIHDMEVLQCGLYSVQEPTPDEIAALQAKEKELLAQR